MPLDPPQPSDGAPAQSSGTALITPLGLGGAILFGIGLAAMAVLPVGLVLWASDAGTLLLVIGCIALLPGLGLMAAGGYFMYRSVRPRQPSAPTDDDGRLHSEQEDQ